jgi:hypothetical protein
VKKFIIKTIILTVVVVLIVRRVNRPKEQRC